MVQPIAPFDTASETMESERCLARSFSVQACSGMMPLNNCVVSSSLSLLKHELPGSCE